MAIIKGLFTVNTDLLNHANNKINRKTLSFNSLASSHGHLPSIDLTNHYTEKNSVIHCQNWSDPPFPSSPPSNRKTGLFSSPSVITRPSALHLTDHYEGKKGLFTVSTGLRLTHCFHGNPVSDRKTGFFNSLSQDPLPWAWPIIIKYKGGFHWHCHCQHWSTEPCK